MRRALVVIIAVLAIAAAVEVLTYTVFFKPEAWLFERSLQKMSELSTGPSPRWPPKDAAKRFHKGAGPCLRYAQAEELSTEAEDEAALDELQESGVLESLEAMTPLLREWSENDERSRHGDVTDAELLLPLSTDPSLGDRLAIAFHGDKLAALERAKWTAADDNVTRKAAVAEAQLPQTQRDLLEAIWTRHRDALAPQGRIITRSGWKSRVTKVRLERIRAAIAAFHQTYKKCPVALDDLDEKVAKSSLVDGFGREFNYEKKNGGCRVTSLGFDGYPGGLGPSQDLQIEVGIGGSVAQH